MNRVKHNVQRFAEMKRTRLVAQIRRGIEHLRGAAADAERALDRGSIPELTNTALLVAQLVEQCGALDTVQEFQTLVDSAPEDEG